MNRRILFSVFILFLIVSFATAASFDPKSIVGSEKLRSREIILNRFQTGQERVKVLVRLAEPTLRAPVDWKSPAAVGLMRARISSEQTAILSKFTSDEFILRHRYGNIEGFSGEVSPEGLNKLLEDPAIASVEPEILEYPLLAQGIALINGWQPYRSAYRGQGVAVAISDTGVDYTHPMLGNGGFPNSKVIGGYDFGDDDADPIPNNQAHGTACAGIAAGDLGLDGDYIGGVAYDAKIYALKITPSGSSGAFSSDIIEAWDWCISHKNDDPDNPLMVISHSFGSILRFISSDEAETTYPLYAAAADRVVTAGITIFAASGNDGDCNSICVPAAFSSVISVGAVYDDFLGMYNSCVDVNSCNPIINADPMCLSGYSVDEITWADKVTAYSNTASFLDILAPSSDAYTTDIVGSGGYSSGDYEPQFGGTSAACPYAAGAAASIQSAAMEKKGRYLLPAEVKDLLVDNGDPITDTKVAITKPRVNLGNAIDSMTDTLAPEPNPAQWQIVPTATGMYTIAMEAKAATDDGDVEYMFECVTNGTFSSVWQSSPAYERGDFTPGTSYTFRLRVRDDTYNMTEWSTGETTTTASVEDNLAPSPNPSQWTEVPRKLNETDIYMVAKVSTDENGPIEYRFECTSHPAYTKDWSTDFYHELNSLSYDTYTFTVQARDSAPVPNTTTPSSPASVILSATGGELLVPSDLYGTIQSAINAANNGDTVIVAARQQPYTGQGNRELDFHGKAITVRSENPDNPGKVATTIIDCQRSGRAFIFKNGEGPDSIVAGFTIRNGQPINLDGTDSTVAGNSGNNGKDGLGGAIRCTFTTVPTFIGSSPTIRNCVITNCTALGGNGGDGSDGREGYYSGPVLIPPIPNGSNGGNGGSGYGGGIYCDSLCSPIIENCTISDCNAVPGSGGDGGDGLDENLDSDPNLYHWAGNGGNGGDVFESKGGGIYCAQGSQATIINCTITNCGAALYTATVGTGGTGGTGPTFGDGVPGSLGHKGGIFEGGGVYLQRAYTNTISDTEISQNFSEDNAGGIYCGDNSILELINCDILNNDVNVGDGGGVWYGKGGTLTFNNCRVNQNRASGNNRGGGLYGGVGGTPLTGTTVIINNSTFDGNLSRFGGGIYLNSTELTIGGGSIISDNRATNHGGGMSLAHTDFTIDDTIITGNAAQIFGGGAYWVSSIADINNCTISDNFTTGLDGSGAGLHCNNSSANITNCVLQDNDAYDSGGAISIVGPPLAGGAQEITNCLITGNTVFSNGAGIRCVGSNSKLNNCTLTNNEVFDYLFGSGGGVSCYDDFAYVKIENCILWGNIAEYGSQIAIGDPLNSAYAPSSVKLSYSDIEGGVDEIFIGPLGPVLLQGLLHTVIDADPLFASADEFELTYYLSQIAAGQLLDSPPNPCVDTGFGSASALASLIGFDPTTRTDHVADTGIVDMGYHYEAAPVTQYQLEIEVVDVSYGTNGRLYADWKVYGVDTSMADPNTATVNQGTQVQLSAVPDEGYIVKEWTNADGVPFLDPCDPNNNIVTMDSSKKVTVEFITLWPSLTTSIDPTGGAGTISHIDAGGNEVVRSDPCRTSHRLNTDVELVATPANPSQVIIWSGTNDDFSTSRFNTVTMDGHKDVTVKFYSPKTWYVGGDVGLPRLQDAIDIAGDRDIIIIAEANEPYYTALGYEIYDRAITIQSAHPDEPSCVARTVIEQQVGPGGLVGPAFMFYNVGRDTVLNGITIRGFVYNALGGIDGDGDPIYDGYPGQNGFGASILCGVQTGWAFIGGAFVEVGAPGSPTIKNCVIADSWVSGGDGGNGDDGDDPNIWGGDGGWPGKAGGAGLSVRFNSNPHVINCTFDNCVATGGNGGDGGNGYNDPDDFLDGPGGRGGGWTYGGNSYWFGVPWLWGNHDGIWDGFYDIYTEYTGMGGAVFVDNDCSPRFEYCTFTNCRSEGGTNGICGINGWLPNDRFEPQIRYKIPNSGGAVYVADRSEAAFIGCVFNNNVADTNGVPAQISPIVSYGGGAAFKDGATPLFDKCVFNNNLADAGGGMYWKFSSPQISDGIFVNNSALHGGGALFVGGSGVITGSIFNGNLTTGIVGEGGAICSLGANASIINTEMNNNTAGSGGGIYISNKDIDGDEISDVNTVLLRNCLITNNTADSDGGGVSANWNSDPDIINCTIADNTVTGTGPGSGGGGGLYSCYGNYSKVINNIFWGNTATMGPQIYVGTGEVYNENPSTVDISYSNIQGGEAAIYLETHPTDPYYDCQVIWDAITNLTALPLFISGSLGDYYLSQMATGQDLDSPCIDNGFGDITSLGLSLTTRIDHVEDAGVIDIGYHYDPRVPTVMHELTINVVGGNGSIWAEGHEATGTPVAYDTRGVVNLLADPCDDYVVRQWTGTDDDTSTSPRNTVTMDDDKTVTVEFEYHPPANIIVGPLGDFATIAPAVAAAYDKDTIIIQAKTASDPYTGPGNVDIDFQGKSITIRGEKPNDPAYVAATVIDCGGTEMNNHRGFIFRNGEDTNSVLAGLTITNGFIAGAYGGNFVDVNGVLVNLDGLDATGDGYGGGILIENSSSPTIRNCVITNCTVTGGYGGHGVVGGIDPDDNGIDGGIGGNGFGNGYGGAIYCDTTCSPIIIGCEFRDNRVSGGTGGDGGDGGSPYASLLDGTESSGGAGGDGTGFGYGAAIYFDQQAKPDIKNCQFINNIATGGVGALGGKLGIGEPNTPRHTDGALGNEYIFGVTTSGTFGLGYGGGIYYSEQCEPNVVDSAFNDNAAYSLYYGFVPTGLYESFYREFETYYQGGGIHVEINNKDISLWNCDFTDNLGGGVYLVSGAEGVDIYDCSFIHNTATLDGGGVYIGPGCVDVNLINNAFRTNSSDSSGDFGEGGGGLNCKSDAILGYCSFSANTTLGYGGAINCYLDDNTTLNQHVDNCSFANNSSTVGGAIYFKNFDAEFADCYIMGNTAEYGGGMALVYGSLDMNRGAINKNTATAISADGGGLSCVTVSGSITNYMFCENEATGPGSSGGAAYLSSNTSPSIVNCLFANNVARRDGGAIAVYSDADAHITNSTFSNNWVDAFGGGIYCDWESSATIKDCIFNECFNHAVYESEDRGTEVTYSLFNANPHGAFRGYNDSGLLVDYNDMDIDDIDEGDVHLNIGRTKEDELELFVTDGPLGDFYLNQDAGENPAIDGGSAVADTIFVTAGSNMGDYTTDVKNVLDGSSIVDIGYHYADVDTLPRFEVTASVTGGEGFVEIDLEPDGEGRYYAYAGTVVKLTVKPRSGWRVKAWYGTDDDSSTAKNNTVVVSFEDKHITVEFELTRTLTVSNVGGGDDCYSNIQDAIYDANDGDLIIVLSGVYYGPQTQINKTVVIRSKHPENPDAVIIDSTGHAGPVFAFGPDCDVGTVLNGFTIRNSNWFTTIGWDGDDPGDNGEDGPGAEGGAIVISPGASPLIKNCIIRDNRILGGFGGRGEDADTTHNAGRGGWGGWARGGGVYCGTNSSPTFINCQIINNQAVGGWGGHGGDSSPQGRANYGGNWSRPNWYNIDPRNLNVELVLGQHLWEKWNEMAQQPGGTVEVSYYLIDAFGWEYIYPSLAAVPYLHFGYFGDYRWYSGYGGGVFCNKGSNVTFIDCTISGNLAQGGLSGLAGEEGGAGPLRAKPWPNKYEIPSFGGGVYCATNSTVKFTNCTISNNMSSDPTFDHSVDNLDGRLPEDYDPNDTYRNDPYLGHGGGICAEDTAVVEFVDCIISGNTAAIGGGIHWANTDLRVSNCEFISNTAGQGGGLFGDHGSATIIGSTILDNSAVIDPNDPNGVSTPGGGGMHLWAIEAEIRDCEIRENQADAYGGGVYVGGEDSPLLENCLVTGNIASSGGGGISVNTLAQLSVFNCTVADNEVIGTVFDSNGGGGLNCYDGAYADIVDSIFWGNVAQTGRQIAVQTGDDRGPSEVSVVYSDIEDGATGGVYVDLGDPDDDNDDSILNWDDTGDVRHPTNLDGTGTSTPLFVTGYMGDYYLSQIATGDPVQTNDSPCVDRGSDDANSLGMYRHTTRTDRAFDTGLVDIGYHYILKADIVGDYNFDGRVDDIDLGIFNSHWLEEGCDFPDWCQGTDLNEDGVVNYLDYAIFAENYGEVETVAPKPDPMTWAAAPSSSGQTSIIMSATKAYDNSGYPVEYQFGCFYIDGEFSGDDDVPFYDSGWLNPNVSSGWADNATLTWVDDGLQSDTAYGYKVRARDVKPDPNYNAPTKWSVVGYARTGEAPPDLTPPTPDPMQWVAALPVVDSNSVTMTAVTATDNSGFVEYYFEEISGNTGGDDSGWQASPVYTDANLIASTTYIYRVRARDDSSNSTAWSADLIVTTLPAGTVPDTMPPLPNPSQWAIWPTIDPTTGWHYMQALTATDAATGGNAPVWYYFECVVGSGIDSGWQLSSVYTYYHTSACYYWVRTCDSIAGSVPPQPNPANATGWSPAGYTGTAP
jgi:hypothetical protein